MTEAEAKRRLREMLRSMTAGSVLHLLSELFAESAGRARRTADDAAEKQAREAAAALFVVAAWASTPPARDEAANLART